MKTRWSLAIAVGLLVGCAVPASALTPLTVCVDVDGTAYLVNTTDKAISFDGYQIVSQSKSGLAPAGWDSISDRVPGRIVELIAQLGAGALTFGEANPGQNQLAELNLGGVGTLQGGARFSLGKPFKLPPAQFSGEYVFFYNAIGGGSGGEIPDFFCIIPEPSSVSLAGLGLVGLLAVASRRRARRPVASRTRARWVPKRF